MIVLKMVTMVCQTKKKAKRTNTKCSVAVYLKSDKFVIHGKPFQGLNFHVSKTVDYRGIYTNMIIRNHG